MNNQQQENKLHYTNPYYEVFYNYYNFNNMRKDACFNFHCKMHDTKIHVKYDLNHLYV